jgi:hypothetical protein
MKDSVSIDFINKELNEHDCYIAELIVDNNVRVPNRTFFPAHWTQEQVTSKIYEAYANFKKSGITPVLNYKGKYTIRGFTKENIEIEMILTTDAEIKTAYPIID